MNLFQQLFHRTEEPPSQSLKIAAGVVVVQGLIMGHFLLKASKVVKINEDRLEFLFDILDRNVEHLTEFDIIALTDLGLFDAVTD